MINFLFQNFDAAKRQITERLFKEISEGKYLPYISEIVLREISQAPTEKRAKLEFAVKNAGAMVLEETVESFHLARRYVEAGLIPEKYENDALHLAVASVEEMDVVVSWNMEHMVKLKTKRGVCAVNQLEGYRPIEILIPEEVVENVQ